MSRSTHRGMSESAFQEGKGQSSTVPPFSSQRGMGGQHTVAGVEGFFVSLCPKQGVDSCSVFAGLWK